MTEEEKFIKGKIEECTRLIEASSYIGNKKAYAKERTQLKCVLARIQKLQKENLDAKEEVEKKDKMIELMAEAINVQYLSHEPCDIELIDSINRCKKYKNCIDCIKQYFEKKGDVE